MATIDQLRSVFGVVHLLPLERSDAEAIVELAQLVVDIDGSEGPDEIKLFFDIGKVLFELAEAPDAEVPTFASGDDDEERMFELATQLKGTPVRELAYVVARLLAAADLDVAPEEDTFIDRLRGVLSISKARAEELASMLAVRS